MKPLLPLLISFSLITSSLSAPAQQVNSGRKVLMTSQELGLHEPQTKVDTSDETKRPMIEGTLNSFNPLDPEDCLRLTNYLKEQPSSKMSDEDKHILKLEVCNHYDWKRGRKIPKENLRYVIIQEVNPKNVQRAEINPYNLPDLGGYQRPGDAAALRKDNAYMWILGALAVAVIAALPSEVSKWDDDQRSMSYAQDKWYKNVSGGPVMDDDDAKFNWIGHPIAGAGYYVVARKHGYGKFDAFQYSAKMSTFYWEFGMEAIAEKPSIQDIIITPSFGSPLGELMYQANEKIEANGGKIMGSRLIGKVGLFLTNPIGEILQGMQKLAPKLGVKDVDIAQWTVQLSSPTGSGLETQAIPIIGLKISFDAF